MRTPSKPVQRASRKCEPSGLSQGLRINPWYASGKIPSRGRQCVQGGGKPSWSPAPRTEDTAPEQFQGHIHVLQLYLRLPSGNIQSYQLLRILDEALSKEETDDQRLKVAGRRKKRNQLLAVNGEGQRCLSGDGATNRKRFYFRKPAAGIFFPAPENSFPVLQAATRGEFRSGACLLYTSPSPRDGL